MASSPRPSSSRPWPEAVVIRSGPPPRRFDDLGPVESTFAVLPEETAWREWRINSSKHDPERLKGPPSFVPMQGSYDEMGRSVLDGVEVQVDESKEKPKRDILNGEEVSQWYSGLSGSGASTPRVQAPLATVEVEDQVSKSQVPVDGVIDLTGDDEDEDDSSSSQEPKAVAPLRVKRNEWFIRRALLKAHEAKESPTPPLQRPSSIVSMINDEAPKYVPTPEPKYALGPENKGYAMLKERLGWTGGGLGKPAGWASPSNEAASGSPSVTSGESLSAPSPPLPVSEGSMVVDMTIGSDSDSELDDLPDLEIVDPATYGPGRTAPIPTALKLDRLGLGHSRSQRDAKGNSAKKVTHTHAEILAAQRRAKYRPPGQQVELGKKGKIKWKEKDKKEREERRRMIAALNN